MAVKLKVREATPESFAPFGDLVAPGDRESTVRLEGMEYWADLARIPSQGRDLGLGFATQAVRPPVQKTAERHMNTPELLLATGGEMIVVVGPPNHPEEPGRLPAASRFQAFRIPEGVAVVFRPGVWHYAPFAVSETIRLLVIYVAGTSESDATVVDFPPDQHLELDL